MTLQEYYAAVAAIKKHGHKLFRIRFIKRSTGLERTMVARLHVMKRVRPTTSPSLKRKESDVANRLLTVYEFAGHDSGYKCIPVDSIIEISDPPSSSENGHSGDSVSRQKGRRN